jgi:hypothetical protein
MSETAQLLKNALRNWRQLVEAAIRETSPEGLPERIQDAQDAVMDQIEHLFPTASPSERQALTNALNSLRELQRLLSTAEYKPRDRVMPFTDA